MMGISNHSEVLFYGTKRICGTQETYIPTQAQTELLLQAGALFAPRIRRSVCRCCLHGCYYAS